MLSQDYIPIGKLRQAYRLNAQDAGILIPALVSQGCVDLYALWHEAERFIAIEENNKKSFYDEAIEPHFPGVSDLGQDLLQQRISTKRLLRHFLFSARGGKAREHLQRIFDRVLYFAYDEPDQQQIEAANRILDMIYEQRHFGYHGKDKVDIAWEYVSPELFTKFCSLFDDAIFANKEAAVLWLFEQGYLQERNVKGLSKELVERIIAALLAQADSIPAQPPVGTMPQVQDDTQTVRVPRALWEGKEPEDIPDAMRQEGHSSEVIAHILYNRRKFKNKTEIGRWLGPASQEDSTCLKRANRLLDAASRMNIVDS